ncbi:helix-turn-helix domain-containing protein [Bifidobacterium sp. ESL0784]|uniref:PucR family transcriptional regulator n=1 Tax=Bifidobacterium sp. ESL0784 TaxID=2983231 RepID=UPI0023F88B64|nr:helix-turn-helix domain-containing protein [Bifidobacterium sp. ESL0784]MDF7640606.1 helix-turn-helix domain-containing protein [Bifidobacterium sp. ESL0784]
MNMHDSDNKGTGSENPADFLSLAEGSLDIAHREKTASDRLSSDQNQTPHITVIADTHDSKKDAAQLKAFEKLGNRENLEAIAFECLANGIHDKRVVSLLHVLGWPETFSCFAIGGVAAVTFETAQSILVKGAHDLGSQYCLVGRSNGLTIGLVVVQSAATPEVTCTAVMKAFDREKPVCLGPTRHNAAGAARTLGAVLSAFDVMPAIHPLPRPARAADMLPERALIGDEDAIDELYRSVYQSLKSENENDPTLQTVSAFLTFGGSLDATGKALNVHPNTVRYRIKRAADATGWDANDPRDAYVLRTAITIGAIRDAENGING